MVHGSMTCIKCSMIPILQEYGDKEILFKILHNSPWWTFNNYLWQKYLHSELIKYENELIYGQWLK